MLHVTNFHVVLSQIAFIRDSTTLIAQGRQRQKKYVAQKQTPFFVLLTSMVDLIQNRYIRYKMGASSNNLRIVKIIKKKI